MEEKALTIKEKSNEVQRLRLDCIVETKRQAMKLIKSTSFSKEFASSAMFITDEILKPIECYKNQGKKIELWDLVNCYDLFVELCKEINKKRVFSPTINTFCHFIGITSTRFTFMTKEESERGEFCRYIKDHISEIFMQNMLDEKIPQIPSIFIAKANLDLRDNEPPVTNIVINQDHKTFEQIIQEYQED